MPPLEAYPKAQVVTFRYYTGRLALLDEEYARAEAELGAAFAGSPRWAERQRERILVYLVSVRLLHGVRPAAALLDAFPRIAQLYAPLLDAYARGDVRAYDAALEEPERERTLVRLGVFVALERAREGCMARLFRRVWAVSGRPTRMRFDAFWQALRWLGVPVEREEAEWFLAGAIARGLMKGYLAHERQTLVLSAKEPFPRVAVAGI